MAAETKIYTRLTRNAAGVGTYTSLWLAGDHLLIVSSTGYNETYARIMFSDIKGLFITPTARRLWWGLPWGVMAAISVVSGIVALTHGNPPIAAGVFAGVAAAALIFNAWLGGGCRVQVLTGVQTTVLPSLVRTKKTRAVLARLQPLILAAQAERGGTHGGPPAVPVPDTDAAESSRTTPPPVPS